MSSPLVLNRCDHKVVLTTSSGRLQASGSVTSSGDGPYFILQGDLQEQREDGTQAVAYRHLRQDFSIQLYVNGIDTPADLQAGVVQLPSGFLVSESDTAELLCQISHSQSIVCPKCSGSNFMSDWTSTRSSENLGATVLGSTAEVAQLVERAFNTDKGSNEISPEFGIYLKDLVGQKTTSRDYVMSEIEIRSRDLMTYIKESCLDLWYQDGLYGPQITTFAVLVELAEDDPVQPVYLINVTYSIKFPDGTTSSQTLEQEYVLGLLKSASSNFLEGQT